MPIGTDARARSTSTTSWAPITWRSRSSTRVAVSRLSWRRSGQRSSTRRAWASPSFGPSWTSSTWAQAPTGVEAASASRSTSPDRRGQQTGPASSPGSVGRRGDLPECLVARLEDREHAVEQGDLEDLADIPVAADEQEASSGRAQSLHAAEQDAERRRIDERRLLEIDHDYLRT